MREAFASFDYYEVLGVSSSASKEEIKAAYRKKILACHPDHHPGDKRAEEEFKKISEAYGILGDDQRRKSYDFMNGAISGGKVTEETAQAFVEAFGKIIRDVKKEFEDSESIRKRSKKSKKKAKSSVKKDDDFVVLKQGGSTFRVKRMRG